VRGDALDAVVTDLSSQLSQRRLPRIFLRRIPDRLGTRPEQFRERQVRALELP